MKDSVWTLYYNEQTVSAFFVKCIFSEFDCLLIKMTHPEECKHVCSYDDPLRVPWSITQHLRPLSSGV